MKREMEPEKYQGPKDIKNISSKKTVTQTNP
jgi:hypothetical protein